MNIRLELAGKDRELMVRKLKVKVNSFNFSTPIKALAYSGFSGRNELNLTVKYPCTLGEVCRNISLDNLKLMREDESKFEETRKKWRKILLTSKIKCQLTTFILMIDKVPNEKLLDILMDVMEGLNVDIIVMPLIKTCNTREYMDFILNFIEFIETINLRGRLLAHSIPFQITKKRSRLINTLKILERLLPDIIVYDFGGSNPFSSNLYIPYRYFLEWKNTLEERKGSPILVYGVNIKYRNTRYPIPARDVASLFMNVDILGSNHVIIRIKKNGFEPKLLDIGNYAYFKLNEAEDNIPDKFKENTLLSINDVIKNKDNYRLFNVERQLIETENIKFLIEKGTNMKNYIKSKKYLDPEAKSIILKTHKRY